MRSAEPDAASADADAGDEAAKDGQDGDAGDAAEKVKKEEEIAVNLQGADLKQISRFLMDKLGKPVVTGAGVDDVELSVMAPGKMPLSQALELLGNALRSKGVVIVRGERVTQLLPVSAVRQMRRDLVGPDKSVRDLPDSSVIVDKVFKLKYASVDGLRNAVLPALPDYAFLTSDPNLNVLTVTAAGADLVQIERLVERLDVPGAGATVERIFNIKHGDPAEVANLVRAVLAGSLGIASGDIYVSPLGGEQGQSGNNGRGGRGDNDRRRGGNRGGGGEAAGPGTLLVEKSEAPIMLTPNITRRWIIASAPPSVMERIERWVKEFDVPTVDEGGQSVAPALPYELVTVRFADVDDLSEQLSEAIRSMPDASLRDGVKVVPFANSGRLLVYGSAAGRGLVETLLKELDVEVRLDQAIEEITLQYAGAESVKTKIEDLFNDSDQPRSVRFFYGNSSNNKKELTVTADEQRNTVTVKTDPARLAQIKKLIAEQWDTPLDYDDVKPKVYSLEHSDPVQVQTLLENMFSRSSSTSSFSFFSGERTTTDDTPVGALFGQFSFEALANSNKLIVSTKSVGNYVVIDELIAEIDQPQEAGTPVIIELKHANAEDVAEQLNAMFSEAGTPAAITRAERGLSASLRAESSVAQRGGGTNNNNNNNNQEQQRQRRRPHADVFLVEPVPGQPQRAAGEQPDRQAAGGPGEPPQRHHDDRPAGLHRAHARPSFRDG